MQPLPASSSTFTHTHAYILTQTMYIKGLIKGLHVFAVTQRYHILCLQSYTSASLNRNRLNLHSKVLSTLTPHHHSDSTPISSPKLVLPSLLLSSILTSTWPHKPQCSPHVRGGTRQTGAGDEEGHVSWGRELTLQGAGKSWVGVLPSFDLGLMGRGWKRWMLRSRGGEV